MLRPPRRTAMPHDSNYDYRLAPLHRLRDATADLLDRAEAALSRRDGSQTPESVAAIRRQLESFDQRLQSSRRTLLRSSHR
jgi:hypothetical protein